MAGARLNADVPVTAVASINQASLRFGDARVVLECILHLDSDKSVPGMLRGMDAPLQSLTTSGMSGTSALPPTAMIGWVSRRVSARRASPCQFLFPQSRSRTRTMVREVSSHCTAKPALKRIRCPGGRVPRPGKQDTALSGLSGSAVGSELVEVVDGTALAPAAAANPRVLMMPGGHIAPNALRPLRRPVRAAVSDL